jgi:hypothetical protein
MRTTEKEFFQYINGSGHRPINGATTTTSTIQINPNVAAFILSMTMQRVDTTTTGTAQFVATGNFPASPLLVYWTVASGSFWYNQ